MPVTFECTPSSLLAASPCLACVSPTEKLAVLVAILATAAGEEMPALLEKSACFTCISPSQFEQSILTIAANDLLGEETTPEALLAEVRCIRRCSNPTQLRAALLYLLCNDIAFAHRA